jgi:hypothetical protein
MDPYLEHPTIWPDVHHRLATQIADELTSLIKPRYLAIIATRFVTDYLEPEELGIVHPDVDVIRPQKPARVMRETVAGTTFTLSAIPPAPVVLTAPIPTPVSIPTVEIRDRISEVLVTAIEILSPVNKREPGFSEYQEKRERLRNASVHILEIDFLRQGRRSVQEAELPQAPYFVFLTRAGKGRIEVWPIALRDKLPVVPVPLRAPDKDVPLDLDACLKAIYDRAAYDLRLNYAAPPIPPLNPDDARWAETLLKAHPSE